MNSSTISRLPTILLSALVWAAACASTASTADSRPAASLDETVTEDPIPRRSCSPANTKAAAADGLLADFSTKQGQVFAAVPRGYATTNTLSQSTEGGHLVVNVSAVPDDKPRFLTASMLLDGCIDASGFAGVEFSIAGSLSGCSLVYASVDPEHQYVGRDGPYPPQTRIAAAELTSQPRTIRAPFAQADIAGRPATPTDASKLAFVQWMVIVPVGSSDSSPVPPCTGKLVIDDVKLYR
jgi:hypothetical protein